MHIGLNCDNIYLFRMIHELSYFKMKSLSIIYFNFHVFLWIYNIYKIFLSFPISFVNFSFKGTISPKKYITVKNLNKKKPFSCLILFTFTYNFSIILNFIIILIWFLLIFSFFIFFNLSLYYLLSNLFNDIHLYLLLSLFKLFIIPFFNSSNYLSSAFYLICFSNSLSDNFN